MQIHDTYPAQPYCSSFSSVLGVYCVLFASLVLSVLQPTTCDSRVVRPVADCEDLERFSRGLPPARGHYMAVRDASVEKGYPALHRCIPQSRVGL